MNTSVFIVGKLIELILVIDIKNIELTAEIVRDLLDYNPETGEFTWKVRDKKYCEDDSKWRMINTRDAGKLAGCVYSDGYRYITILLKTYRAHRIAWLHYYGEWPENQIDHINRVRDDNRIENLRDVTQSQNQWNRSIQTGRTSKYNGVVWHKRDKKWQAAIRINGKKKHLGYFVLEEDAARAYDRAALKYYGEYANFNFPIENYLIGVMS